MGRHMRHRNDQPGRQRQHAEDETDAVVKKHDAEVLFSVEMIQRPAELPHGTHRDPQPSGMHHDASPLNTQRAEVSGVVLMDV